MGGQLFAAYTLLHEISQGSARISEIVGALKSYSYLGQAPAQTVDLREGLDNTLVILRSKLKPASAFTAITARMCRGCRPMAAS